MSTTTNIALNEPAYGSTSPTWDQPLNSNFTILDKAFGSTTSISVNTGSTPTYTIVPSPNTSGSGSTSQCARLLLTGSLAANQAVLLPTGVAGMWAVTNSTSGAYTVQIASNNGSGSSAGTLVTLTQGYSTLIYSDGTNVIKADDAQTAGGGGVTSFSAGTTGFSPNSATTGPVTLSGTLAATNGGTGLTSPGSYGNVLTSNGSTWVSQAPTGGGSYTGGNGINISGTTISMSGSYSGGLSVSSLSSGSTVSAGNLTASTTISAGSTISTTGGDITANSGNISTSSGNVSTSSGKIIAGNTNHYLWYNGGIATWQVTSVASIYYDTSSNKYYFNPSGVNGCLTLTSSIFQCSVTPYANQTAWSLISDRTEKENITDLTDGTSRISALKPVNFDWIKTGKADSGFIAQDFEEVYPANVSVDEDGKKRIGLSMNFYADLVSTIQTLQNKVAALEARLTAHNL